MKKLIYSLGILTGIFLSVAGVVNAYTPFYGGQLGNTPTSGYVLQSTGANSVSNWVATSTLGFGSGGGGSGTVLSGSTGQFPFYNSSGTTLTATSSLSVSQAGNLTANGNLTIRGSFNSDATDISSDGAGDFTVVGYINTNSIEVNSGQANIDSSGNYNSDGYIHIQKAIESDNNGSSYLLASDGNGLLHLQGVISAGTATSTYAGGINLTTNGCYAILGICTQGAITLTTSGSSGAATFAGNVLNIPQYSGGGGSGNVATSTTETAGNLAFWTSTGATPATLGKVATTTVSCSGASSCTTFTVIGGSPITISTSGSGAFPFTPTTDYGATVYATSTPTLWFQSGLYASSTSYFTAVDGTNKGFYDNGNFFGMATGTENAILLSTSTIPSGATYNFIEGYQAARSFTTANGDIILGTNAGELTTSANASVFIGTSAGNADSSGSGNTFIGYGSGKTNTIGADNTMIGYLTNVGSNNLSNVTAIGYDAIPQSSNTLMLGGTGGNAVNVGIGTDTPFTTLSVVGNIYASGNISCGGTCGGGGGSGTVNASTVGYNAFYNGTGTAVSGTSTIYTSTASYVGIATTTPATALDVNGGIYSEQQTPATSTTMTIDFSIASNNQVIKIGAANVAISLTNANLVQGKTLIINIVAPPSGLIGSTTFAGGSNSGTVIWAGGINPYNSVINGSTDQFVFTSMGTSTGFINATLSSTY